MNDVKVAVIGASGVVGRAMLEQLSNLGIPAIGLSRRAPDLPHANYLPLDLSDAAACQAVAQAHLGDVTHVVYAALYEMPGLIEGWHHDEQMRINLQMITNILEPLRASKHLRHVTLLQGTKAYGAHVAPMKIPGLEREPRHPHKNFYWLQQDYLADFCGTQDLSYTIWRPQIIIGHALHAPMNMLAAIGVYAAIQAAKGQPLHYPGGPSAVTEAIDADLLADAICFSLDQPAFANETFNITNGDVFRWQDIWPELAEAFGMTAATAKPQLLAESLYDEEDTWQQISRQHKLTPHTIRDLVGDSFFYADALFNARGTQSPPPALLSTIKLRQAGFHGCVDTAQMFRKWINKLREADILPGPS